MSRAAPFAVSVSDEMLEDLQRRLDHTLIAPDFENGDWGYGFNGDYLRELVDYWRDGYDWRAQESAINAFPHFRATVGGVPIHFIHQRGIGPKPLPIVLTHGWPWTFWDFNKIIDALADPASSGGDPEDAFDVIVPSLPGHIFSTPLRQTGVNYWKTADLWVELMQDVLGYQCFAAHGGDWGSHITSQLGHKYASELVGIHMTGTSTPGLWNIQRPWTELLGRVVEKRRAAGLDPDATLEWERARSVHAISQSVDPQTLAHALHDSPSGLCAWLVERRRAWSDCGGDLESVFTKDELLTTVMLYWVTRSYVTSARYYKEAADNPWTPSHDRSPMVEAPTGLTLLHGDSPPGATYEWLSDKFNIHLVEHHDQGGHFAAMENPDAVIAGIRGTFRDLRKGRVGVDSFEADGGCAA